MDPTPSTFHSARASIGRRWLCGISCPAVYCVAVQMNFEPMTAEFEWFSIPPTHHYEITGSCTVPALCVMAGAF